MESVKKVTMSNIVRIANLSQSTVSHIINKEVVFWGIVWLTLK